jgi:stearoyl-CoA desaturase (delta-9 desaturase)
MKYIQQYLAAEMGPVTGVFSLNLGVILLFPFFGTIELSAFGLGFALLAYFIMNGCGIIIFFHRYLSHHSFEYKHKWIEQFCLWAGILSGNGSPLGWAGLHRTHHHHADTVKDPHEAELGFWKIQFLRYHDTSGSKWLARDLITNEYYRFIHNWYFLIVGSFVGLLFLLFGWPGVYYGFCIPSAAALFSGNLINWIAHHPLFGYRSYDTNDKSRNVWWLLPTLGECWHNNHHQNPTAWTTREKWWEFDLCGMFIRLIKV